MKYFCSSFFVLLAIVVFAQKRTSNTIYKYIEEYGLTAINTMHDTHIPASIIMAVAIEESGAGTSEVAKKAKNHFGMTAGSAWKNAQYCTKSNTCFRQYDTDKMSFESFGKLLKDNPKKYGFLFDYDRYDYKKWAYGIEKSGYCTSKGYATKLIGIIQKHQLHNFDSCIWEFK